MSADDNKTIGDIAIKPTRFTEYDTGFSFSASLTKSQLDRLSTNELPLILNAIHNRYRGRQTMMHGFTYGFPLIFDGGIYNQGFIYTFGNMVLGGEDE
jgi:hypothetical protein